MCKVYRRIICLFLFFSLSLFANDSYKEQVKRANEYVKKIKNGTWCSIEMNVDVINDAGWNGMVFYYETYDKRNLVAAKVIMTYGSWFNEYLYIYRNGNIVRCSKETRKRPDNPPMRYILYNEKGECLAKSNESFKHQDPKKVFQIGCRIANGIGEIYSGCGGEM